MAGRPGARRRGTQRSKATRSPAAGREGAEAGNSGRGSAGSTRASGLSVAFKFSLATSAVLAVSMVVFTIVLFNVIASVLSDEIDEAGVSAVRAMAATDVGAWGQLYGTSQQGKEQEMFETGKVTIPPGEREQFVKQRSVNQRRAEGIALQAGTKILDAVILDASRSKVLNGKSQIKFAQDGDERLIGEVSIVSGLYTGGRDRTQARMYSAPFHDVDGELAGFAVVALSEDKIQKTLSRLLMILGFLTLIFIGVGVMSSWLLAQRITHPVVLLAQDMEQVAEGNLEHRTRAHSTDEIGVLARTMDRMTQNLRAAHELEREQAAQTHQLEIARQVQNALTPERLPAVAGYESIAHARSSGSVRPHYYDIIPQEDGTQLLVVASASGTGIPAAMVVIMARSLLKGLAPGDSSPAEILRRVNRNISGDLRSGMYVTLLLVRLDPKTSTLRFSNAGHHPLLLCRKGAAVAEPVYADGIALGFDKGPVFDRTIKDGECQLGVGDRILLCTRSLFSLKNSAGKEIGEKPIYELFARESAKNSAAFVPLVTHQLDRFTKNVQDVEDHLFLTLKRIS